MSVSGSYAVVAIAVFIALGVMIPAVSNTGEEASGAVQDQFERSENVAGTDISIVGSDYNFATDTFTVSVENTGGTRLSVRDTDVLVDGEYVTAGARTTTVAGASTTDLWAQGETIEISVDSQLPDRVKVVTEHGVAAFAEVDIFRLTTEIGFTDTDEFQSVGPADSVTSYNETGQVIGPPVTNFVSNDVAELPTVDSTGNVVVATETGDRTELASNARASASRLAAGRWQGSGPSVFFVDSGTQDIVRVTANGSTTVISTTEAEGIVGIRDFDGDGRDELIYGGNGPDGNSNSVNYIDDDGTIVGTEVGYGTDNGIGVGEPADFDGDGTVRVPIVDGSNNVQLVDSTGATESVTSSNPAAKASLGAADLDRDGDQEIFFVSESSTLTSVDNVTAGNDVRTVTDDQGDPVPADKDAGAA